MWCGVQHYHGLLNRLELILAFTSAHSADYRAINTVVAGMYYLFISHPPYNNSVIYGCIMAPVQYATDIGVGLMLSLCLNSKLPLLYYFD